MFEIIVALAWKIGPKRWIDKNSESIKIEFEGEIGIIWIGDKKIKWKLVYCQKPNPQPAKSH